MLLLSLGTYFGIYAVVLLSIPLLIVVVGFFLYSIWIIEQGTAVVIERYGRFRTILWHNNGYLGTGLHLTVPFVDSPRHVTWRLSDIALSRNGKMKVSVRETRSTRMDLRENLMDFPQQPVITRDNVEIKVHPMILYKLFDPVRVAYETFDLAHAVEKLVQTALRSVIGDMALDDTLASRVEIQRLLMFKIRKTCQNWGCLVMSVELLEIIVPNTVQKAMHQQLTAERERRAKVVTAEGEREKMKTEAEGFCQSQIALASGAAEVQIQRSMGLAQSRVIIAKAEAEAVRTVAKELSPVGINPTQYLIGMRYIDVFRDICKFATSRHVYFPFEANIIGGLRNLNGSAAGVRAPASSSARA